MIREGREEREGFSEILCIFALLRYFFLKTQQLFFASCKLLSFPVCGSFHALRGMQPPALRASPRRATRSVARFHSTQSVEQVLNLDVLIRKIHSDVIKIYTYIDKLNIGRYYFDCRLIFQCGRVNP